MSTFRPIIAVIMVMTFIVSLIFIGGGVKELVNTPNYELTDESGVLLFIGCLGVVGSAVMFFLNKHDAKSDQIY